MTDPGPRWRIATPTSAPGALAGIELAGDPQQIDDALRALGISPVKPGHIVLRSLAGIDTGLLACWTPRCVQFIPHGGELVLRELVRALAALGLAEAENPTADLLRALYPEAADELESRMLHALARARSPLAIELLLDQPRRWRLAESGSAPGPDDAHSRTLNRVIEPPLVAAIGASNIGKSSLVNALAGRPVSIVADEPGTTRDHVGVQIDLAGLVVRFVDMPGQRLGAGPLETQAQLAASELIRVADLVLRCGDGSTPPIETPVPNGGDRTITVALRSDLGVPVLWDPDVVTSARTGTGIDELAGLIRSRLVPDAALRDPRPWRFWAAE